VKCSNSVAFVENSMIDSYTILCYIKFFFILVYFMHKFGSIDAMILTEINKNMAYDFFFFFLVLYTNS
jgi:hypothetical protein